MNKKYSIEEISAKLTPIFTSFPIESALIFGSYANGNATEQSDLDIVIDSKGEVKGIDFYGILDEITEALKIPVDLIEASQIVSGGKAEREIRRTGVKIYERS